MMTNSLRKHILAFAMMPLVLQAADSHAQSGARSPGAMSTPPSGSMFGDKPKREFQGPSLSATDELVSEIRVEGNRTIPASRIMAQMQTRVGRPFDPQALGRDVRKLASLPWFVDVTPLSKVESQGRVIILRVTERSTIRYIQYLGNARLRDKKLAKETGLKVGRAIDPYAVEDGRRKLEDLYRTSGYPRAQVTVLEGNKPEDKGVVYVINEGVQQKIAKVTFEGNGSDFASDRRLKTKVKSKPGFLWLIGGKLNRDQIDGDVNTLTAYYRAFGFFQAKVGRIIEFNEEGTWATIRFVIHEGPRYQVRSVRFMGNEKFASDDLASGVKLPAGAPFEQDKLTADVGWLEEVYGSQGYVFAKVRAEPVFLEEPGQIDLVYHIEEGQKWRVGKIFVHINGDNPHTRIQTALNRLSIRPGEIMDIRELRASERRLQASSLFLSDPVRGVTPKITYRIPEVSSYTASGSQPQIRGQSPEAEPSVWQRLQSGAQRVHEAFKPNLGAMFADGDELDVHLMDGDAGHQSVWEVTLSGVTSEKGASEKTIAPGPAVHHVVRKEPIPQNIYTRPQAWQPSRNQPNTQRARAAKPIIRGQSPATNGYGQAAGPAYSQPGLPPGYRAAVPSQPATAFAGQQQPASYAPVYANSQQQTAQAAAAGYGGQAPRAVSPSAAPAGYFGPPPGSSATVAGGSVQQTQFTNPYPTGPPSPGFPSPGVVGTPYVNPTADPSVLPIPADGGLVPDYFGNGAGYPNSAVDLHVNLEETQTGRFMVGVGVNSDAGVVGQILIDERNFDWRQIPTSWQDVYNGTAFRGGGQRLRLEAAPGTQVQRYLASWQEPYLMDTPVSLGLSGSYYDRRFQDWDEQRLGGRVSTGYGWVANDLSAAVSYRYESIKIRSGFDLPELNEVTGQTNQLHGFGLRIANDTRNNPFLATDGHYLELQLEQVVGTFDYPRLTFDGRRYFLLRERPDHSGRHVLSANTRIGFTGSNTPIYENFFAGGFSTLRGFDFRGASPTKRDTTDSRNIQVGGEFMWLNSLEYLFPLTADDMINGVAFVDFGTVEENITLNDFRVAPGFGLRVTVPAMGPAPIALDFAFPIAYADTDDRQVFTFNVGIQR